MKPLGVALLVFTMALTIAPPPVAPTSQVIAASLAPESTENLVTAAGCGTERWDVKTLSDADAAMINRTPKVATVEALAALPVPGTLQLHTPRFKQERQVYRVTGRLVGYKLEKDSDFHIVIGGTSGRTMIVEAASPNCVHAASAADLQAIRQARQDFLAMLSANHLPAPVPSKKQVTGRTMLSVSGVLFFDLKHGQWGVADNGVELHPILRLSQKP